jgi:hypothetical protein
MTVIRDCARDAIRTSVELSDNYFVQCFSIKQAARKRVLFLHLRRYSKEPSASDQFVERRVAEVGSVSTVSLVQPWTFTKPC